jgi:hypothetical protein
VGPTKSSLEAMRSGLIIYQSMFSRFSMLRFMASPNVSPIVALAPIPPLFLVFTYKATTFSQEIRTLLLLSLALLSSSRKLEFLCESLKSFLFLFLEKSIISLNCRCIEYQWKKFMPHWYTKGDLLFNANTPSVCGIF